MHTRSNRLLLVLLISGLLIGALWRVLPATATAPRATTRYVAVGGNCGGMSPCYAQLQAAVNASAPGDEIKVAHGTYHDLNTVDGHTQVVYIDKTIVISGGYTIDNWDWSDWWGSKPEFDAGGGGHVFYITGNVTPTIYAVAMTGGAADYGGGLYVEGAAPRLLYSASYSNTAHDGGAGAYFKNSAATLTEFWITDNATAADGIGGGLLIDNSPLVLLLCSFERNSANRGGGVMVLDSTPTFTHTFFFQNRALPYHDGNRAIIDGYGGGLHISGNQPVTLQDGYFMQNTADWGGGVYADGGNLVMSAINFISNSGGRDGGGFYSQNSTLRLTTSTLANNSAGGNGAGLALVTPVDATLRGNHFTTNAAQNRGGGLYGNALAAATLDGNVFIANSAAYGGAIFLRRPQSPAIVNSVLISNTGGTAGALYIWGGTLDLLHPTFSNNGADDGRAVVVDSYPGQFNPALPPEAIADVAFHNTIFDNSPTAFFVTASNFVDIDGILWHGVTTKVGTSGVPAVTRDHELDGDPLFLPDGYHIDRDNSPAVDQGVATALARDIDGHARPLGAPDLGVDETVPAVSVEPESGGSVTVTAPSGVTLGVSVPPGAIDQATEFELAPLAEDAPPQGGLAFAGALFDINAYRNGAPAYGLTFDPPIIVRVEYEDAHVAGMDEATLTLMVYNEWGDPQWTDAACGAVVRNALENWFEVPICHLSRYATFAQPNVPTAVGLAAQRAGAPVGRWLLPAAAALGVALWLTRRR